MAEIILSGGRTTCNASKRLVLVVVFGNASHPQKTIHAHAAKRDEHATSIVATVLNPSLILGMIFLHWLERITNCFLSRKDTQSFFLPYFSRPQQID